MYAHEEAGRAGSPHTDLHARRGRGETSLGDGERVPKTDARVEAYGAVDELNAVLGLALAGDLPVRFRTLLERVQNELFDLGADLSVPEADDGRERLRVAPSQVEALEQACDEENARLETLRSFVLPGGTDAAARLHHARTVCRRAEREAFRIGDDGDPVALAYLNRLSDLLFILARAANADEGVPETLWQPGSSR